MFDLVPSDPGTTDRRTARSLGNIERIADVSAAKVAAVHHVAQRAAMWSLMTTLIRRRAELLAPDAAESQAMIALAADMTSVAIIQDMPRQMR